MTTYRNNFDKPFNFGEFNAEHIRQKGSGYHIIFFDPSHIRKSGKHTFGKSLYCGAARAVWLRFFYETRFRNWWYCCW
jgi:hypothetical protein